MSSPPAKAEEHLYSDPAIIQVRFITTFSRNSCIICNQRVVRDLYFLSPLPDTLHRDAFFIIPSYSWW